MIIWRHFIRDYGFILFTGLGPLKMSVPKLEWSWVAHEWRLVAPRRTELQICDVARLTALKIVTRDSANNTLQSIVLSVDILITDILFITMHLFN
jgi:hypothetical protein